MDWFEFIVLGLILIIAGLVGTNIAILWNKSSNIPGNPWTMGQLLLLGISLLILIIGVILTIYGIIRYVRVPYGETAYKFE